MAETRRRLLGLDQKGAAWPGKDTRGLAFRLAPFIMEDYFHQGGARGIMGPVPALHWVVPARGSVKTELVLPYDDVKALLVEGKAFSVGDCICLREQELPGRRECTAPMRNCLSFSHLVRPVRPGDISREGALSILDQAEQADECSGCGLCVTGCRV